MLKLITFKPGLGTRCPSPFGMKAEALLAMSGLTFEKVFGDVRKAPKKKFPVLKDGDKVIPDSSFIQQHLETNHDVDFDSHLNEEQWAKSIAFRRLIEDHFYFINMHFRWTEHADAVRDAFFQDVPSFMRNFIFKIVQKGTIKTNQLQGLGRHTREELIAFGQEDVEALAAQLGDNAYFLGDKISSIDASVYGALHNLIDCTLDTPISDIVSQHQNLVDYTKRINTELFNAS